eukprot:NODE_2620_length_533_cov_49.325123_g2570_i0.p1 GENE.NODE_2620_length_533_cov_49.325123_g2570_i0~~NODE_2620_length_533_cov_49.325123_g2570_i0.p1  ORF type:complete len:136 (+),score=27.74 NODE_2620_length_533_cov_49.325123_g2570_i0:91-498(+)
MRLSTFVLTLTCMTAFAMAKECNCIWEYHSGDSCSSPVVNETNGAVKVGECIVGPAGGGKLQLGKSGECIDAEVQLFLDASCFIPIGKVHKNGCLVNVKFEGCTAPQTSSNPLRGVMNYLGSRFGDVAALAKQDN